MPPTPESQWLLTLLRTNSDRDPSNRLGDPPAQVHWDRCVELALRHGLGPLLVRHLNRLGWRDVPSAARERLQAHTAATSLWNRFLARELVRIVKHFRAKGIRGFALKGPALAVAAYGDLSTRSFTDLDLCVHPDDVRPALQTFIEDGYQPEAPWPTFTAKQQQTFLERGYHTGLVSANKRYVVELHWALTPPHHDWQFDVASVFNRLAEVEIEGERIPTLAHADLLPYLCVHGAKHGWERLEWIYSLSELVKHAPALDWPALLDESRRQRIERLFLAGLLLAEHLFGVALPSIVHERQRLHRLDSRLVEEVSHRLFIAEGPIGPFEKHVRFMRLRERWCDKIRHVWFLLGRLPGRALKRLRSV